LTKGLNTSRASKAPSGSLSPEAVATPTACHSTQGTAGRSAQHTDGPQHATARVHDGRERALQAMAQRADSCGPAARQQQLTFHLLPVAAYSGAAQMRPSGTCGRVRHASSKESCLKSKTQTLRETHLHWVISKEPHWPQVWQHASGQNYMQAMIH
jgi:hypothetical protein